MPVRSPNLHATADQTLSMVQQQDPLSTKNIPTLVENAEETNENVSKEKLNNMKLMMKTFVLGALREKEQVNYFISFFYLLVKRAQRENKALQRKEKCLVPPFSFSFAIAILFLYCSGFMLYSLVSFLSIYVVTVVYLFFDFFFWEIFFFLFFFSLLKKLQKIKKTSNYYCGMSP